MVEHALRPFPNEIERRGPQYSDQRHSCSTIQAHSRVSKGGTRSMLIAAFLIMQSIISAKAGLVNAVEGVWRTSGFRSRCRQGCTDPNWLHGPSRNLAEPGVFSASW